MNDFLQQYELYLKAVAKANELNKAVVFDALAAACLTRVTVEFDGEGDSGQINGIAAHAGEAPAEFPSTALTLHQATHGGSDLRTGEVNLREAIRNPLLRLPHPVSRRLGKQRRRMWHLRARCPESLHPPRYRRAVHRHHQLHPRFLREANMAHPYHHALSSVRKWGGAVEDYIPIHDFFDESKMIIADFRHRALHHHAAGIFMAETLFGSTLTLSTGRVIPVRWIGEQHIREDLGFIPSFADWAKAIRPEPWMGRALKLEGEASK